MKKYIAFMDLLGTKVMAVANPTQYREVIRKFQETIEVLSRKYKTIEIHVFSDCAYLEEAELKKLCLFFRDIRECLLEHEICFNAAICEGRLGTQVIGGATAKCSMINFTNDEVVKVYSLQNAFCGAGVYIDPQICTKAIVEVDSDIVVDSVYAGLDKSNGKLVFKRSIDVKFRRNAEQLLMFILNLYTKNYILDKRASRYYLTLFTTYIREQKNEFVLKDDMKLLRIIIDATDKIYNYEDKITLILILINKLYDEAVEKNSSDSIIDVNEKIYEPLSFIYERLNMEKLFNLREISPVLINDRNKLLFADFAIKKVKEE